MTCLECGVECAEAASQRGGRLLLLNAPCDGFSSGLMILLAWWAELETLLPGESVTYCGRRGGVGMLLVSSPARGRAFVATDRRRPAASAGEWTVQDVPHQPDGKRSWRRHLQRGPMAISAWA
jgi:CubicO group peptidase (beta-lactamase class C family)